MKPMSHAAPTHAPETAPAMMGVFALWLRHGKSGGERVGRCVRRTHAERPPQILRGSWRLSRSLKGTTYSTAVLAVWPVGDERNVDGEGVERESRGQGDQVRSHEERLQQRRMSVIGAETAPQGLPAAGAALTSGLSSSQRAPGTKILSNKPLRSPKNMSRGPEIPSARNSYV